MTGKCARMLVNLYRGKIHRATITQADLNYVGSITIDRDLMEAAGILPYERLQVLNLSTGDRLETYAIVGEPGTGTICLNGPAARSGQVGDLVTIIAYTWVEESLAKDWQPLMVLVDECNRITRVIRGEEHGRAPEGCS